MSTGQSSSEGPGGLWLKPRLVAAWPLVRALTLREFRARYRQSVLDVGWSLVTPVLVAAIYGVILHSAFNVNGQGLPYLTFVWAGMVVWTLFSSGVGSALTSLIDGTNLISKVYFPREVLPMAVVGSTAIDLLIGLVVLLILDLAQTRAIHATILMLVPSLAIAVIWTAAIAVWTSVITVFIRDVNHLVLLVLRVGFFATPVMYGEEVLPAGLRAVVALNPLAACIEGVRDALAGTSPAFGKLLVFAATGLLALLGSLAYTRSVEDRMIDVI